MLWVSSLRRICHSTSLRATGSLIVFCRSAACVVFPLRAAVIASFKAAMSAADGKSLGASAARVGRVAACGAGAGVLWGRGLGSGTLLAGEAVNATTRLPLARRPVKNRVGVRMLTMVPFIVPPRPQYRRTITSDRGEKAAVPAAPPLGAFFVTAFPLTMV